MDLGETEILKPLITKSRIKDRVSKLVDDIAGDCKSNELIVVGLLKGSFMFLADLVRLLYKHGIQLMIDFMTISSYGAGIESSGNLKLIRDISTEIKGKQVLIVDDILDTGRTLDFVSNHLSKKKPEVLKTCVFLDKPINRVVSFQADYVGFTVPDAFVVGYGLDYDSRYRELPHISIISFK